jgi:tritrans,polycis-undecaprenyl-diphosphate synthase [geranylgeranyl-diphosphate specific]
MHIGLVPDGNRRFMAKKHIENLLMSYDMGINKFYDFLEWCYDLGVKEVTIYALSTENITARDKAEVETLYKVFNKHALKGISDKNLQERGVRVNICGDREFLLNQKVNPKLAAEMIENMGRLEEATKKHRNFTLNLAVAYGGRQELLGAFKEMASAGEEMTEDNLKRHLWVKDYPDIIIRTSERRLSNFLLWQSAYSEIYFVPKLWQEFEKADLSEVIEDYKSRERRYGR